MELPSSLLYLQHCSANANLSVQISLRFTGLYFLLEIVKEEARETGEFVFVLGSFDRPERQLFCHHGAWAAATASPDSGMPMSKHRRCDRRQTQKQEENITELTTAAAMTTTAPR